MRHLVPSGAEFKPTKVENPNFVCRQCNSNEVEYKTVESFDGAHEDLKYHCRAPTRSGWLDGIDY